MSYVTFTCVCVNRRLFDSYAPSDGEVCLWRVRASVLAGYSWEGFMREVKVRLLSKSIHKGKFVGFNIGGTLAQQFHLSEAHLELLDEIQLVIENMNIDDNELAEVVQSKLTTFDQVCANTTSEARQKFDLRVAIELAFTSDKIEGTTIEADEAKANLVNFRAALPPDQCDSDHIEMRNHMIAIMDLVYPMKCQPLTNINLAYMMALHRALDVSHMKEVNKGAFRTVEVTIASGPNPQFTRAADVPRAIDDMLHELHAMDDSTDALYLAAWLHFKFVQIHPFVDGNGRVGRLLMNTVLLQRGYPLVCIHPNIRNIYFKSLQVARRIENGALALPEGTKSPYDFLKRILSEFTIRSLDLGIYMHRF